MKIRVGLVDDEIEWSRRVETILNRYADIEVVMNEGSAVDLPAKLCQQAVDVLLLNWEMPRVHGREALKAVRADSNVAGQRVAIWTVHNDREIANEAMQKHGADGFICKEVDFDVIADALRAINSGDRPVLLR